MREAENAGAGGRGRFLCGLLVALLYLRTEHLPSKN